MNTSLVMPMVQLTIQWIANLMKNIMFYLRWYQDNSREQLLQGCSSKIYVSVCMSVGSWPGMNLLLCSSSLLVTALVSFSSPSLSSPTSPWAPSMFKGSRVWRQQRESKRNLASFKNKFGYKDERMKRDLVHPLMFRRETRSLLSVIIDNMAGCSLIYFCNCV